MAAPAPCTQHVSRPDPLKRGHAGLYDAHFELFVAFFRDVNYNPKVLAQNLRDANWPELASAFGDALFSALLCEGTLFRSGKSVDAQRDIAEEFGFLYKLAAAVAFNQTSAEYMPKWYCDALALFVVRVVVRFGVILATPALAEKFEPKHFEFAHTRKDPPTAAQRHEMILRMCLRAFLPFVAKLHPMLPNKALQHSSEGVFGLMVAFENVGSSLWSKLLTDVDGQAGVEALMAAVAEVVSEMVCTSPCQNVFDWDQPLGYFVGATGTRLLHKQAARIQHERAQRDAGRVVPNPLKDLNVAALAVQRSWTSHLHWLLYEAACNRKFFEKRVCHVQKAD